MRRASTSRVAAVFQYIGWLHAVAGFATLPQHTLQEATSSARIPPTRGRERPLSAVEIIQVALTWHFARLACGLVDNDPLLPDYATASTAPRTAGGGGGAAASSAGASSTKNVK